MFKLRSFSFGTFAEVPGVVEIGSSRLTSRLKADALLGPALAGTQNAHLLRGLAQSQNQEGRRQDHDEDNAECQDDEGASLQLMTWPGIQRFGISCF